GEFLRSSAVQGTAFETLRPLSWIDEAPEAVHTGKPTSQVIKAIQRAHTLRRVRTLSRLITAAVILALSILALAFGVAAWRAKRNLMATQEELRYSDSLRLSSLSREITAATQLELDEDPQLALMVAAEAMRATRPEEPYPPASEQAIRDALA